MANSPLLLLNEELHPFAFDGRKLITFKSVSLFSQLQKAVAGVNNK